MRTSPTAIRRSLLELLTIGLLAAACSSPRPTFGTDESPSAGGTGGAGQPESAPAGGSPNGAAGDCNADDAECDDGVPCTMDECTEAGCSNKPDDDSCTDAVGGSCDPKEGCQYPSCQGEDCVVGPCEEKVCTDGECVVRSLCEDGQTCCAGECVAANCDDGVDCTQDSCDAEAGCQHVALDSECTGSQCQSAQCDVEQGCVLTNVSGSCDDGVFCNGADTCADGECGVHAGPSCGGQSQCDEDVGACTGCVDDADCGEPRYGMWSECTYANDCSNSGERSRSVTPFRCEAGQCNPTESSTETDPSSYCARQTDGVNCDDGTFCNGVETCGNGACQTRPSACQAGCDETKNMCVECLGNADCDNGLFCDGAETCNNGSCRSSGKPCAGSQCDEGGKSCAECLNNSHCGGAKPLCDDGACVQCKAASDCDNGVYCDGAERCQTGSCKSGAAPCSGNGEYCKESNDSCASCLEDKHCDDGNACTANRCNTGNGTCTYPQMGEGDVCQCSTGPCLCTAAAQCTFRPNREIGVSLYDYSPAGNLGGRFVATCVSTGEQCVNKSLGPNKGEECNLNCPETSQIVYCCSTDGACNNESTPGSGTLQGPFSGNSDCVASVDGSKSLLTCNVRPEDTAFVNCYFE